MPEPASMILRRALSDFERAVLVHAARGGAQSVFIELAGVTSVEHAKVVIAEVKQKAERAIASASASDVNGNGARTVGEAMLDAAGVPAEQAGTMLEGAGDARPPGEAPPTQSPAPVPRFVAPEADPSRPRSVAVSVVERRERIVELLRKRSRSGRALSVELGVPDHAISNDLKRLAEAGRVARTGRNVLDWPRGDVKGGRSSPQWRYVGEEEAAVGSNPTPAPEPEPDVQILEEPKEEQEMSASTELVAPPPFAGGDEEAQERFEQQLGAQAPVAVLAETHDGVYFSYMALLFDLARYADCPEHVFDRIADQVELGPPSVRRP